MKRFFIGMFTLMLGIGYTFGQDVPSANEVSAADTIVQGTMVTTDVTDDSIDYEKLEKKPRFRGGEKGLCRYLTTNVRYPVIAMERHQEGTVVCTFVIANDGQITDVKILQSSGYTLLDNEAVRLVKAMPKWRPGKLNSKAVSVRYTLPVHFQLGDFSGSEW